MGSSWKNSSIDYIVHRLQVTACFRRVRLLTYRLILLTSAMCKREQGGEKEAWKSLSGRVEWVKCRALFCRRSNLIRRNYCHALFMQVLRLCSRAPGCTYASVFSFFSLLLSVSTLETSWRQREILEAFSGP